MKVRDFLLKTPLASPTFWRDKMITIQSATLEHLTTGYQLCATTEGKSLNAIAIVTNSVSYFVEFLASQGISN